MIVGSQIRSWLGKATWRVKVGVGVVGLLLVGGWFLLRAGGHGGEGSGDAVLDRYYTVERGAFDVTVLSRGELDAIKNYSLKFEGRAREGLFISQIVEDKSSVQAGDPVVSFTDEQYLERINEIEEELYDREIDYQDALDFQEELFVDDELKLKIALEDANENLQLFLEEQTLKRDEDLGRLTDLANKYQVAKDALTRYENLEYRSKTKSNKAEIDTKEEEYYKALDDLDTAREAYSTAQLMEPEDRAKAERDVKSAESKVENNLSAWEESRKSSRQFRRYDHPQKMRQLVISADNALLSLRREIVRAESNKVRADRRYRYLQLEVDRAEKRIVDRRKDYRERSRGLTEDYEKNRDRLLERKEELEEDYAGLVLRAPVAGIVSLGAPVNRGQEGKELKIGTKVSPNEVVARIPDLSKFLVKCDIPEIFRSQIEVGQAATLKSAALPDLVMSGRVSEIDTMSSRLYRWDSRSPRVYSTVISTDSTDSRLIPGMTVEVEILVEKVEDVLYVPVEALYNKDGEPHVQVRSGGAYNERVVETGRASTSFAEITDGLEAGDVVLLHKKVGVGAE